MSAPPDAPLAAFLEEHIGAGPFTVTPISGGHSNETALLSSAAGRWVLRRPPVTTIAAGANDLGRERRVLAALADTDVPVPRVAAYADAGVIDERACLVMEHCAGHPLTDTWPDAWPGDVDIGEVGRAAVDVLAALHRVDPVAVGLEGFGRPERYLERQVARWRRQERENRVRDLPAFDAVGTWLEAHRPESGNPAILHGDFHLDNCLVVPGPPTRVSAVIDWELATIGDPLVDLGLLLAFWGDDRATPVAMPAVQALTRSAGTPPRAKLAAQYADLTSRPVDALPFYMVLALFKLAAIVEGAYARFVQGEDSSPWARSLGDDVPRLLAEAQQLTQG